MVIMKTSTKMWIDWINMDLKDWIYTLMVTTQLLMILKVRKEASDCGWSRQSKWIGFRIIFVVTSVCFLTITAWWFQYSGGDALLDWILTIGMIAMTLILIFHLPDILDSMSDENLAEDLNIQENNNLK